MEQKTNAMKTQVMIALIFAIGMSMGLTSKAQMTEDKKAKVAESSVELVASFVPEKRAELDAKKAMKVEKERLAEVELARRQAMKNPDGKPNRMFQSKDGRHRGGNGKVDGGDRVGNGRSFKAGESRLR